MKRVSRYSGRYYENRYPRGRRFTEESSVKKYTAEDFIKQEDIDDTVREVLEWLLNDYNDECEEGEEDEDFDPAEAFEECVERVTNNDNWAGVNDLADQLVNYTNLEEKITFKNYKQWCKLYDIDLSEYEYIR